MSKDDFHLNSCGVCWDQEGEDLRKGIEKTRSENEKIRKRAELEAEFENEVLINPDLDLSKFSSEELKDIRDNSDVWNYDEELRARQQDKDRDVNSSPNLTDNPTHSNNTSGNQPGLNDDNSSKSSPSGKANPEGNQGDGGYIEHNQYEDDDPNTGEGKPYWSKEQQDKVVIPEGFFDPDNPSASGFVDYGSNNDNSFTKHTTYGGENFDADEDDVEPYWSKEQQDKVVIPEGFFDPDNPYDDPKPAAGMDPVAEFMDKMRKGRSELSNIANEVKRQNQDFMVDDRKRIAERVDDLNRARSYAEEAANRQIDRIERSAAATQPDLSGRGIYNPNIPTPVGTQTGSYNEAELGQKCANIMASYQSRAQTLPIGNSKREAAINEIKSNNIQIEGLNKCMSSVPSDSRMYRQAYAQALAYKTDSDRINQRISEMGGNGMTINTAKSPSSRKSCGPAIDGPGC